MSISFAGVWGWGQVCRPILSGFLLLSNLSSSPFSPTLFSSCLQSASQWPHSREMKSFVVGLEHPSPGGILGSLSLSPCEKKLWLLPPSVPGVQLGALAQLLCRARLWALPCFRVCYMEMAILLLCFLLRLCLLSFSFL